MGRLLSVWVGFEGDVRRGVESCVERRRCVKSSVRNACVGGLRDVKSMGCDVVSYWCGS